jgi:hypothetical protein
MTRIPPIALSAFLLSFFSLSCFSLSAQTSIWNTPAAYLGQKPPGNKPEPFAINLVMKKDSFSMDRVAWSEDGTEFYYPSNNTWFSSVGAAVRCFKYRNGKWEGPVTLFRQYYAPTFSVDGKTLYLLGGADRNDRTHAKVFRSHRMAGGGWTKPEVWLRTTYGTYMFMPTLSGTAYIASNVHPDKLKDYSDYDVSTLRIAGKDTIVKSLGAPLNTPGFDGDFYVARDESYIIISNKETKDFECELAISFRKPDGTWTVPASLGPEINDRAAHRWGEYVSPDGKYLFYSTGTSPKDCHIVWVRWDTLLAKLKRENLR